LILGAAGTVVLLQWKWAPKVNATGYQQQGEEVAAEDSLNTRPLESENRSLPHSR
jgi:hypothetical protein